MNPYAFYVFLPEILFFLPLICTLPPDSLDVHIGHRFAKLTSLEKISPEYKHLLAQLSLLGYHITTLDPEKLPHYAGAILSSSCFTRYQRVFNWSHPPNIPLIYLPHATDFPADTGTMAARMYIYANQRQAEACELNKVTKQGDPNKFAKWQTLPKTYLNEYAYTGPWHLGEWLTKRFWPKTRFRELLEETLKATLPATKPIVFFLEDEFCHPHLVGQALAKLAKHVTLIIKARKNLKVRDAFNWPSQSLAPNLPRLASDLTLAGFQSGSLATNTMLGLPVIPYYTKFVWRKKQGKRSLQPYATFSANRTGICAEICQENPPLDLTDTEAILDRLNDSAWQSTYLQRLPQIQRMIFGDYELDHCVEHTGQLLLTALEQGTLGSKTIALRIRPEYAVI